MDFQLLSDLKDQLKDCLDASCDYRFFISLGRPPADCNSIALWYQDSIRNRAADDCTTQLLDTDIVITITRCCVTADAEPVFNFTQEEKDAKCFLDDLNALICCISNIDLEDLDCGPRITQISPDREKLGGCYSADLIISMTEEVCCVDGP